MKRMLRPCLAALAVTFIALPANAQQTLNYDVKTADQLRSLVPGTGAGLPADRCDQRLPEDEEVRSVPRDDREVRALAPAGQKSARRTSTRTSPQRSDRRTGNDAGLFGRHVVEDKPVIAALPLREGQNLRSKFWGEKIPQSQTALRFARPAPKIASRFSTLPQREGLSVQSYVTSLVPADATRRRLRSACPADCGAPARLRDARCSSAPG